VWLIVDMGVALAPQSGTQVVARGKVDWDVTYIGPPRPPVTVSVRYWPRPSPLRARLEDFLSKVGIGIIGPSFVVTVKLPPRDTVAGGGKQAP
jgi:hypothetical protein